MSDADGAPVPDFLDRLLARHAAPAATPRPGVVRVQPRLPGPFERIEAVWAGAPEPDGTDLLWPASTPTAAPTPDVSRPAPAPAGPRTERERTIVRTERAPADPVVRSMPPVVAEAPLLRPATPVTPGPRPVPDATRRTAGPGRGDQDTSRTAASVPIPPGTDAAPRTAVPALRPSAAETAAAREAVRQAAARRPGRAAEQVVQVQIGRLEVTAAPAANGARPRAGATPRQAATVSLADYLARGHE
ncbi:hypothetical protein QQY66_09070 [Streptomyces sp. DG2A-72]|uniref:hypothetical protein n=1 Tax=Streptomyces sp. DG2A-72 TaxID=3051386 RepID=UPI00265C4996|nr:hypothetical protein [Streptomyces sp. DG2A-72]MDO0931825.1 hypothetical protein [Streptomyces sp. DG2A-72]